MTDELDPVPPAAPAAPASAAEPVAPADPDEAQAIEVQGGKMVPLPALKAVREENKTLKEKAGRVDALEAELAKARPYQQFVEANPQIVAQAIAPPPAAPVDPKADPELVELARSLDYFNADGSPNLDRAAKHQQIIQRQAQQIAERMVAPVAQGHAQSMSNNNWQQVVQEKLPNGQPIDPAILGEFWRHLPVSETAKPQVAALVRDLAITAQMRKSPLPPAPAPPAQAPIHTESIGRLPQPAARMTDVERGVAAQRGMTEDKYRTMTKDFTPGRMNPLED